MDDSAQISAWVAEAVAARPAEWARLREGETKLLGIFVGAVMKMSRGSADPKLVNQLLLEAAGEGSGT